MPQDKSPDSWAHQWASRVRDDELEEYEFGPRLIKSLKSAGINTMGELITKTEAELDKIPGINRISIDRVKEVLEGEGLTLGIELPDKPA